MELLGWALLERLGRKHSDARAWLERWVHTVQNAQWRSLDEVRREFPSADGVKLKSGLVVTVFNVRGNNYRLLTRLLYGAGSVQVLEMLTHAEYSKDTWKERY